MIYADSEFSGIRPHSHGGSEADHVKALQKMGFDIKSDTKEKPAQLSYLYDIYFNLRFSRIPKGDTFSLMAREPLTFQHIEFYSKNTGLDFEQWEIDCIMSLDSIFERHSNS